MDVKIRNFSFLFIFILSFLDSVAQNKKLLNGSWEGKLKTPGGELRLILHMDIKNKKKWEVNLDSPDQGVEGIEVSFLEYDKDSLVIKSGQIMAMYTAAINPEDSTLKGTWQQGITKLDLSLKKTANPGKLERPQEPEPPYPYQVKDVKFLNATDSIRLAGTLTLPEGKGPFPAAVLISGSGPQNRNEELMGHKPFLVIADYLTRNGIAVLRYDDRGVGESEGDFSKANNEDFSHDAEAAFSFLERQEQVDTSKTGLIGHSEGGIIAPMVAKRNPRTDFIILLAGVGVKGSELLIMQQEAILSAAGYGKDIIRENSDASQQIFDIIMADLPLKEASDSMKKVLRSMSQRARDTLNINGITIEQRVDQMLSPWYVSFVKYEPSETLPYVKCPVLAINGSKDLQVPAEENLSGIKKLTKQGGNKKVTTKRFEGLNHLFQEAESGLPGEYGKIEQTFSPEVLIYMKNWIQEFHP